VTQSITLRSVRKSYGRVVALDHIDLNIREGEFFTLLGPSGSGKTTLLMVVAGFIRADGGSLKFGNTEVIRMPPHRRDVGVVFQNYALFPHMTVAENIAYPLKLRHVPLTERRAKVDGALKLVRLDGLGHRDVQQLSGGQRQRVALARALVFEPRVLLMDEPLSALDRNLREQMQVELKRLHRSLKMTTIYVTHDQGEAMAMSDRVAVMNNGQIIQMGTPRDLYETPRSRFVAKFIGESNLIPVSVAGSVITAAGTTLRVSGHVDTDPSGCGLLVIRPERIQILDIHETTGLNRLIARMQDAIYRGDELAVYATLADGTEISVRCGVHHHRAMEEICRPGQQIAIAFHPEDCVVVKSA